jgi:hypothetical protein
MWPFDSGSSKNPEDEAGRYLDRIPDEVGRYYDPYIRQGQAAYGGLNDQYNQMMNNPGGFINGVGSQYQQSPGFKFALQQALQGANQGAAAGGMAGSPQNQQQNMAMATNMANQDYNNWLQMALGQHQQGLAGQQGFYDTGARAGMGMGDAMGNYLSQRAQYGYAGQAARNAADAQNRQNFLNGVGGAFGGAVGGVPGAWVGGHLFS